MIVNVCVLQILEIHGSSLEEQFPNWNSTLGYLCNVQKCLLQGVASLHETTCLPTCLATFRCEMMPKQAISVEFPKFRYFGQKRTPRPSAQGEKNKWLVQRVSNPQNLGNSSPIRFSSEWSRTSSLAPSVQVQSDSIDFQLTCHSLPERLRWEQRNGWKLWLYLQCCPCCPLFWIFLGGCLLDCNPGHRFTLIYTDS